MASTTNSDHFIAWYQVPLVWLGVAIVGLSFAACVHLVILSQSLPTATTEHDSTDSAEFRGVPLNAVENSNSAKGSPD